MSYNIINSLNETRVELESLYGLINVSTGISPDHTISWTATTSMQSAMGKVLSVDYTKNESVVDTVWNEKRTLVLCKPLPGLQIGTMVYCSEHLGLSGEMDIIASKLKSVHGDINFLNLTDNKNGNRARIDLLTGEVDQNGNSN
jgi:hypothetical protein